MFCVLVTDINNVNQTVKYSTSISEDGDYFSRKKISICGKCLLICIRKSRDLWCIWQGQEEQEKLTNSNSRFWCWWFLMLILVLMVLDADLGADGRFYKIFQKLDSLFIEDECARAYISFKEFHQFEKSSGKTFVDFIKFENCIIGW